MGNIELSSTAPQILAATENRVETFRILLEAAHDSMREYGVSLKPYHQSSLPSFSALSDADQHQAIEGLRTFQETLRATTRAGFRLDNQTQLVWHALKSLGLVPPAELFQYFKPDHVVEIYSMEGLQFWRNLNFLKNCSYTLEEVYSIPWNERYERQADRVEEAMSKVMKLLRGETPAIYHADISSHRIEETVSEGRFVLSVAHHWLVRLEDRSGKFVAWMGISDSKVVATKRQGLPSTWSEDSERPGLATGLVP